MVLTFESVDEILWCDHSNQTSYAVLSQGAIYFLLSILKSKFCRIVDVTFQLPVTLLQQLAMRALYRYQRGQGVRIPFTAL